MTSRNPSILFVILAAAAGVLYGCGGSVGVVIMCDARDDGTGEESTLEDSLDGQPAEEDGDTEAEKEPVVDGDGWEEEEPLPERRYWAITAGTDDEDYLWRVLRTPDGGFIAAGKTALHDVTGEGIWIVRLDTSGNILWQKAYGEGEIHIVNSIESAAGGGFAVAASCMSCSPPLNRAWILRLDDHGDVLWWRSYLAGEFSFVRDASSTTDGGFVLAAATNGPGSHAGNVLVVKLDSLGEVQWGTALRGPYGSWPSGVRETPDRGYVIAAGFDAVGDGDGRLWVVKFDHEGGVVWQKAYTPETRSWGRSIAVTADGGTFVSGEAWGGAENDYDFFVLRLDGDGSVVWQRAYRGPGGQYPESVCRLQDGGAAVAGFSRAFESDDSDALVMRLDEGGDVVWQRSYGEEGNDGVEGIQEIAGDGMIASGGSDSFTAVHYDAMVLRVDENGTVSPDCSFGIGAGTAFMAVSTDFSPEETYAAAESVDILMQEHLTSPRDSGAELQVLCSM